jgi:hypothetical protein
MFFLLLMLKISKSSNKLLGNNCFKNQVFFMKYFSVERFLSYYCTLAQPNNVENEITILLKQ